MQGAFYMNECPFCCVVTCSLERRGTHFSPHTIELLWLEKERCIGNPSCIVVKYKMIAILDFCHKLQLALIIICVLFNCGLSIAFLGMVCRPNCVYFFFSFKFFFHLKKYINKNSPPLINMNHTHTHTHTHEINMYEKWCLYYIII
jgi:hypothetical protein